jgi:HK97 family phage portal protein
VRNPFRRRAESRKIDTASVRQVGDTFYDGFSVQRAESWESEEHRSVASVPWGDGAGFGSTSAMSPERALRLAPVYAAGRLLASSVASLPLQTYRKRGGQRQRVPTPDLFGEPSRQGTLHDWLWRGMASLVYRGNAVGMIMGRGNDGRPTRVEWLDPDQVQVQDGQPSGRGSFLDPIWYHRGAEVPADWLVHIPWFTLPGRVWGLSPIAAYASSVSTAFAAESYSEDWFRNGGVPPGTFKNSTQMVDQGQADVIKDRLTSAIRSHQPIVYGADWEYQPITVPANEAKFVETMQLTATQVAVIYGIPPEKIGGKTADSLTYSTTEQQAIEFVQFTLLPWLTKLESHFADLLPDGHYVKFNVDALIRTDAATRYQNYSTARNIGLLSINEIRAKEDLEPIPDGDGHTPLEIMYALDLASGGLGAASGQAAGGGSRSSEVDEIDAEYERLVTDDDRAAPYGGSTLPYGPGHALWDYWAHGEGFAKWSGAVHKWTTLHHLLVKAGVPRHMAKGLTTNIIQATMPGYLQSNH